VARSSQPVVADADDLQRFIEQHDITTFKAGAVDIDGVWRGKRIAAPYFADAVWRKGTNICNILFGWDLHDVPIPGLTYTGWQTAYPDVVLVPDLSTLAVVPWEPGTASVICDVHELDGAPLPLSPRALLRRVAEQAAEGFAARARWGAARSTTGSGTSPRTRTSSPPSRTRARSRSPRRCCCRTWGQTSR
jgi:glutamine synthetase